MARIRTIKPEFPQSESIGKLSRDARLLYIQIWTIVDDSGRARAASRMLASLLYPYDDDAKDLIQSWMDELEQGDHIRQYEVDGSQYLEVVKWLEHQKIDKPSKSRFPAFADQSRIVAKPRETPATDLGPRTLDLVSRTKDHKPTLSAITTTKYFYENQNIRLNEKDFRRWEAAYTNLNLRSELEALANWDKARGKGWFNAVAGALTKKNRDVQLHKESVKIGIAAGQQKTNPDQVSGWDRR